MPDGPPKALRVVVGVLLMAGFVLIAFAVVLQYAGSWGVPYFSFSSERGSTCKNTLTGYTCDPLTLADVEFYGEVDLPDDTTVVRGTYQTTHDYQLDARLRAPKASAAKALKALNAAYGPCKPDRPSPLDARGLTSMCVLANDDGVTQSGEASSRLYVIGTALRKDGSREIQLTIKSR